MSKDLSAIESHYRVPYTGKFKLEDADALERRKARRESGSLLSSELDMVAEQIGDLQETLHADAGQSLLLVFQGVDASGKDSTVHKVFKHVDAAGCKVHSFKVPEGEETQHDFLWRCTRYLPGYGEIGIYNRSHYEAVLTERVHPEVLSGPPSLRKRDEAYVMAERYRSIREFERHLACNGTVILKFWLHLSKACQAKRLLKRIDKPEKRWKFSNRDVFDREHWDDYMRAYVDAVNATSRSWAPWYVIPANHKPTARLIVGQIALHAMLRMKLAYPVMDERRIQTMESMRERLIEPGK